MMTSSNGNIFRVTVLCAGNSPVIGEFPAQRPVTRSFDVFFDLCLNERLSKQSRGWWFETPSRPLWHHNNEFQTGTLTNHYKNDMGVLPPIPVLCSWWISLIKRLWWFPEEIFQQTAQFTVIWNALTLMLLHCKMHYAFQCIVWLSMADNIQVLHILRIVHISISTYSEGCNRYVVFPVV